VGRAGENGFLRFRLRTALAERARAAVAVPAGGVPTAPDRPVAAEDEPVAAEDEPVAAEDEPVAAEDEREERGLPDDADALDAEMVAYYAARAPEYDDWYLRRGRYAHGPIHDMAWQVDLDTVTSWLDAQAVHGEIVEIAAGTGWWSPLLAQKGELWAYDAAPETLDRARERLLAHGLRAHLHVRDAWAEPDRPVDVVFSGFWLSHVPRDRLPAFLALVRRWLRPGGLFLFVDSRPDLQSGAGDHDRRDVGADLQVRRLADGRAFRVVKVHYESEELARALASAGFEQIEIGRTSRFFLFGRAFAG
jgi:demethylmenaquinone methyltransferase/2-methoxy-6-polyprenyl-1,4-benzoquinol methylase